MTTRVGSAMTGQRFPEEPLGQQQVTPLAESEFNCVTYTVDGEVKVNPLTTDLNVRFVDMPIAGHASLASVEAHQQ